MKACSWMTISSARILVLSSTSLHATEHEWCQVFSSLQRAKTSNCLDPVGGNLTIIWLGWLCFLTSRNCAGFLWMRLVTASSKISWFSLPGENIADETKARHWIRMFYKDDFHKSSLHFKPHFLKKKSISAAEKNWLCSGSGSVHPKSQKQILGSNSAFALRDKTMGWGSSHLTLIDASWYSGCANRSRRKPGE